MAAVSGATSSAGRQFAVLLALALAGLVGGLALAPATSAFDWKLVAALIAAIPIGVAAVLRPRYGMLLLFFAMAFVEEFRGGIGDTGGGGDEALRSERTPFYQATLVVPGLYIPDVLVMGLLLLFLVKAFLARERAGLRLDAIGIGLALIFAATVLSIVFGLAGNEPFGPPVLDLSTLGSVKLPEKNVSDVARYLPVLQYKLFLLLFPAYVLGLLYFREHRDLRAVVAVVGASMLGTVALGVFRLATNPDVLAKLVPVIFDTASVAFMAMTAFYLVGMWACRQYSPAEALVRLACMAALCVLILLSFRRTMWGAIAVAALLFPLMLPSRARGRLLLLGAFAVLMGLIVLGATPAGQALVQSVVSRAQETNLGQASTLYRFAIVAWLVENVLDIPPFGYGLMPLWHEIVRIRFFTTSLENVHSLYVWILVRMGLIGFFLCGLGLSLILVRIAVVYRMLDDDRNRVLVAVIVLSIVMFMFNGVFNPVYANVRHLVPLGLSLALVTNLPQIMAARRDGPAPPAPIREATAAT
jgi:hypothetical protein